MNDYYKLSINNGNTVIFGVLTAVIVKGSIFWDIRPCNPLKALLATCFMLVSSTLKRKMFLRNVG
jgi:hypothetical protein